ncbi:MAG: hypothetical protein M3O55_09405 [Actinomycetota bacterium]|nr:hypothetical protein [Actinomycetota bacterium]
MPEFLGLDRVLPPATATFARDAEAHYLDRPKHCPECAASLAEGLVVEYWTGEARVFATWCGACSWSGEIVRTARVLSHEAGD